MAKIFKFTSIVLALVLLLVLLAVGALITFVSPNYLKPVIATQVTKFTSGRQLTMDGDLSWTFYPVLAVKMNHATLSNPAQFNEKIFAEMDHATIGVKLMPLFHGTIEFTGITLSGLKLNLIKNADGTTNWQDLLESKRSSNTVANNAVNTDRRSAYVIQIPAVDINDAKVSWTNLQAKQSAVVNKFEFHAKEISANQSFPISSAFNFTAQNPTAVGSVTLSGNMSFDTAKQTYLLNDLVLAVTTKQNNKDLSVNISGDLSADMAQQILSLSKFSSRIANLTLNGKVNVTNLSTNPLITGHLEAPAFDLKALLQSLGQDSAELQSAKNVTANFDFSTKQAATGISAINLQGKINIPELQAAKLKATNVNINANMKDGIADFTSITATLYQGTLQSQAKINLTTATPQISFQSKLANVQAEPLLSDLDSQGSKLKVKGAGNIDIQATTSGANADAITRNLAGKSTFSFQNGVLDGINLGYLIDSASAFLKGQAAPAQGQNVTNFGNLTGTAVISNGVVTNNDLSVISPRFDTSGKGTINLVTRQINYGLEIKPKVPGEGSGPLNINDMTLPVNVTGSLNNPNIKLDVGVLAQYIAKQKIKQVQDKVSSKIADQIKNKVPGQAGALLQNLLGR